MMIALKLLPILQVIVILCSPTHSYPTVYGTKRYGRLQRAISAPSSSSSTSSWLGAPYQPIVRTQRYPIGYYYPPSSSSSSYPDYFYHQPPPPPSSYPNYYPHTSKYEVYQAVLPYYYDRPLTASSYYGHYGYPDVDPMYDLEEEIQEAERKQREDSQPIGQETYFEDLDSDKDDYNDVNAAFLQNLIMSQMYDKQDYDDDEEEDKNNDNIDEIYGKLDEYPPSSGNNNKNLNYYAEDEDVKELRQLAQPDMAHRNEHLPNAEERLRYFQRGSNNFDEKKRSLDLGRLQWFTDNNNNNRADRKTGGVLTKSSAAPDARASAAVTSPTMTLASMAAAAPMKRVASASALNQRGQKEEVLPRPATPVKHPFSVPAMEIMYKKKDQLERERQPSVYDTIKHMLDMEKNLENKNHEQLKAPMRKRIISSDDTLAKQLSVLKKSMV